LVGFLVRMWRLWERLRLKSPLPVRLKRLAALLLDFIFGMSLLNLCCCPGILKSLAEELGGLFARR